MAWRLMLIADVPTSGRDAALRDLEAVFGAVPGERVVVVDRDPRRGAAAPTTRARLAHLRTLRDLTRRAGAGLLVNGRVDLAAAIGADGVQLPERGLPAYAVRAAFPDLLVGRSCHDRAGLSRAAREGAAWATLSPVRRPWTPKVTASPPLGVGGFARARRGVALVTFALGGIGADLVPDLVAAGADGVATIGAVFGRPDPGRCAAALMAAFDRGQRASP